DGIDGGRDVRARSALRADARPRACRASPAPPAGLLRRHHADNPPPPARGHPGGRRGVTGGPPAPPPPLARTLREPGPPPRGGAQADTPEGRPASAHRRRPERRPPGAQHLTRPAPSSGRRVGIVPNR